MRYATVRNFLVHNYIIFYVVADPRFSVHFFISNDYIKFFIMVCKYLILVTSNSFQNFVKMKRWNLCSKVK